METTPIADSRFLSLLALAVALLFAVGAAWGQGSALPGSRGSQPSAWQSDNENARSATSGESFSGRIMKSGNRLVLRDSENLTTYQLDDQQKAHDFINKNVKVTGVLDASTGTIRVRAIEPA